MTAPISDRTLAQQLARRLRSVGAYQLFLRKLGPGEVFVSAIGFDPRGRVRRVSGTASTFEQALLALLVELAADDERSPTTLEEP